MDQLDARMLLMGRGPQMADPNELQKQQLTLANLARADELGAMKLDEYKRDQQRQSAFESELPALVQSNFSTDAVVSSVARNPTAAQAILAEQGKRLKEQYANAKTAAETQEIKGKARKAELEIIGGMAGYLADKQDLSPDDIKAAASNLQRMGLDPRALMPGGDSLDPAAWKAHYAQLANTAVGAAKQIEFKGQAAQRAETARHNQSTEGLTASGQTQQMTIAQMNDKRMRDANAAARDQASATREAANTQRVSGMETKLADDYNNISKGWRETAGGMSKVMAALDTADKNPGSALAAGTAFMKILDPNSVVRESELGMALNASGWFDRATNVANTLKSGRVMTPTQVKALRAAAMDLHAEAAATQRKIDAAFSDRVKQYGGDPSRVIIDLGQNSTAPSGTAKPASGGWKIL